MAARPHCLWVPADWQVDDLTTHMLRHGCGYALANAGHDTRAIQAGWGTQHTVRYGVADHIVMHAQPVSRKNALARQQRGRPLALQ
jgi:integrase